LYVTAVGVKFSREDPSCFVEFEFMIEMTYIDSVGPTKHVGASCNYLQGFDIFTLRGLI